MADRGEGRFNWITGADALPMLSWEAEECHQLFAVFLQAQRRLGIFGVVGLAPVSGKLSAALFLSNFQVGGLGQ